MFSSRRMIAVAKKETQEMIRNWLSLLLTIIAPIILFFLFAFGMPLDVKNIPMAILDEDKTPESRLFISTFENCSIFQINKTLSRFEDIDQIMKKGNMRAVLVIPPKFSENLQAGRPQYVQAIIDSIYTNRAQMTGGYVEGTVASYNGQVMAKFFSKRLGLSVGMGAAMPVDVFSNPWFNPSYRSEDFIVPGVIAIILIFLPPTITSISLSKEKETGSILNMYCSPVTKTEYIFGKSLPYIAITYFNFLLFLFFTTAIFKVPLRGDLILLLLVSLVYVTVAIGIGILVAVLVNTQIAAILITAVLNLIPTFMYSGFLMPVLCLDAASQQTAYSLPTTYYIFFLRNLMLKGVGFKYLANDIMILLTFAISFYLIAILLFKKRLG